MINLKKKYWVFVEIQPGDRVGIEFCKSNVRAAFDVIEDAKQFIKDELPKGLITVRYYVVNSETNDIVYTISSEEVLENKEACEHAYSEKDCPKCGHVFCYDCCGGQNVDQGGKYEGDYMYCPRCGHDYYSE